MAGRDADGSRGHDSNPRDFLLGIADQRHRAATTGVAALREAHPDDGVGELTRRLISQCARDLAVAGAVSGGAAASPTAAPAGAAAILGAEGALNAARLGEMVMAIGILHGHTDAPRYDRARWLAAALGASEGTAVGLTGLAARAGVRGSARLMRRVPTGAAAPGAGRAARLGTRLSSKSGPWGLAALLPYALGASVGAVGNLALAVSVGRAANKYFKSDADFKSNTGPEPSERSRRDDRDAAGSGDDELLDAEFLSERFLDES